MKLAAWSLVKELEAYTLNVTLPIVLPFGALLTRDLMAWALRPTLPHKITAQVCGCYAVATFKRLPKFSTTLVKELEAYTLNATLPIVLPFGALLTPDPR